MTQYSRLVLPALLVGLTACGGGTSDGGQADESVPPVATAGPALAATGSAIDTGDESRDESTSAWCELARPVDEAGDRLDDADLGDPIAVEAAVDEMYERMLAASPAVPAEIAAAVEVSLGGFEQLRDALIAANWDFVGADLSAVDEMSADLEAADTEIDTYNERVCGAFLDGAEAGDGGVDSGIASMRDQVVAALVDEGFSSPEAECLFDNIDFTDPDAASDVEQVAPVFEWCGIDLARLEVLGS